MACKAATEIGKLLSAQRRRKREATEQPRKHKGKFRRMSKEKEQKDATTLSLSQHPGCLSVGRTLAPRCSGLLVGSACSGWGSELFALKHMNVDFTSVFSCDTCSHARTVHQSAHGASQKTYGNVWSDDFLGSPTVQLFVAGFSLPTLQQGCCRTRHFLFGWENCNKDPPMDCQPPSRDVSAGKRSGFSLQTS